MRVEDRRRLLDEVLPAVDDALNGRLPPILTVESHGQWAQESAHALVTAVKTGREVKELLVWLDREEWKHYEASLPLREAERFVAAEATARKMELMRFRLSAEMLDREDIKVASERADLGLDRARRDYVLGLSTTLFPPATSEARAKPNEFEQARRALVAHLQYQLRPNPWRRLRLRGRAVAHAFGVVWARLRSVPTPIPPFARR